MLDNRIIVKMIETAINKGIKDIEDDPKRGIRNLVDLANHFANSPFQKDVLEMMQTMLINLHSPYYNIVSYLVNNVEHDTLKTFGINIGYRSWTYGARKIRTHEEDNGYNVPWTIIFDLREKMKNSLNDNDILRIIDQGKEIGIYTYMFFINNIDNFSNILKENPDCAFVLYTPSTILTKKNISKINSYNNTFFSILYNPSTDIEEFDTKIKILKDNRCLFGLYSYYEDQNIKYILNNKWVHEIMNIESAFGFLIKSKNCNEENAKLIHNYISDSKTNQKHSAFLIDLYEDVAKVDKNISTNPCVFIIRGNENHYKDMSLTEGLLKSKGE